MRRKSHDEPEFQVSSGLVRSARFATMAETDWVSLVGCVDPPEEAPFLAWSQIISEAHHIAFV